MLEQDAQLMPAPHSKLAAGVSELGLNRVAGFSQAVRDGLAGIAQAGEGHDVLLLQGQPAPIDPEVLFFVIGREPGGNELRGELLYRTAFALESVRSELRGASMSSHPILRGQQ